MTRVRGIFGGREGGLVLTLICSRDEKKCLSIQRKKVALRCYRLDLILEHVTISRVIHQKFCLRSIPVQIPTVLFGIMEGERDLWRIENE